VRVAILMSQCAFPLVAEGVGRRRLVKDAPGQPSQCCVRWHSYDELGRAGMRFSPPRIVEADSLTHRSASQLHDPGTQRIQCTERILLADLRTSEPNVLPSALRAQT
jgi:hypothetical protein